MANVYQLQLKNVSCASCVKKIESHLNNIDKIKSAQVNFAERTVTIDSTLSPGIVIQSLAKIGYIASIDSSNEPSQSLLSAWLKILVPAIFGGALLILHLASVMPMVPADHISPLWLILGIICIIIMSYSGGHIYTSAYRSLINKDMTMNTLISLGTLAAWLYSMMVILFPNIFSATSRHPYLDTATIILALMNFGALLEHRARGKTSEAIQKLIGLKPKTAQRIKDNGDEETIAIDQLKVGDKIKVRSGEKIALDGIVIEGSSSVDESMLTGEPFPILKHCNDRIFSGTVNTSGTLVYQVDKLSNETMLSQIIIAVKKAQSTKPKIAKMLDTVSSIFVPFVIIIAIITAIVWASLGYAIGFVLAASIAVLVIACPCALGLATPISTIVGMGRAAQLGILIRNAQALQQASKVTHIVFDKTGTITTGKPTVVEIKTIGDTTDNTLLQLAASVEHHSEHPIATAIMKSAEDHQLNKLDVQNIEVMAAHGIQAQINGELISVGKHHFVTQNNELETSLAQWVDDKQQSGHTVIYVGKTHQLIGMIAIADPIRDKSIETIRALSRMGINITLLTGDQQKTAQYIAHQVGIKQVVAEVLPQDKAQHIAKLQQTGAIVAMVGDGINDAPALSQADVGIAISSGTDIAIESADISLMRNGIASIPDCIKISKATMRNIKQNLVGAFAYNAMSIPIAAGVLYPFVGIMLSPTIACAAMAASSVTVVTNANRLRIMKLR